MQDPDPHFRPVIGVPETVSAGVRRIVAPNPSPMTFRGTNSYLVGDRALAVIDPGPDDADHLAALLAAVGPGQQVTHIVVTHAHLDHSPLARPLSEATGAPVYAFGDATAGRSAVMHQLAEGGLVGGGEGVDAGFVPDQTLDDEDTLSGPDWTLKVLHTPGHFGNHIALGFGDICFTGDLVMGWASSLVSPPDGDLTDFMASCRRLQSGHWRVFHAGHGAPIHTPQARLADLIAHREGREQQILSALKDGPATAEALVQRIYTDIPAALHPAAQRNVLAHLIDLFGREQVSPSGPLHQNSAFALR